MQLIIIKGILFQPKIEHTINVMEVVLISEVLGINLEGFVDYINAQMADDMNWNNVSFEYIINPETAANEQEQKELMKYTNVKAKKIQ